jgi:ABC-type dipeptide/oligopeptide/nickel transport system permease component
LEEKIGEDQLSQYKSLLLEHAGSRAFTRYTGMYTVDGILNGEFRITLDALQHLVLPVITEIIVIFALLVRIMRSGMIEALSQDYIITAKAKGANKNIINKKHARKNAMIPVMTVSGVLIAGLMTGMISVEFVFNRQGLGWWLANSAIQLDIPALLAVCLFVGFVFVIANLIVDISYAYVDPRIRLS